MKTVIVCLLIFVSVILVASLMIAFYHPKEKQEATSEEESTLFGEEKKEEEKVDYESTAKNKINEIIMRYPSLKILLKSITLDHCILLHWQGHAKSNEHVLFSLTNETCIHACLKALQRMDEEDESPQFDLYLCLPYAWYLEKESSDECQEYMKSHKMQFSYVLLDGTDNEDLLYHARKQALVATSNGAYADVCVKGNPRKAKSFVEELRPAMLFPLKRNPALRRIVSALKDEIPWMIRFELRVAPTKGIRDLLAMIPDAWIWMRTSLEKKGDHLILRAPTSDVLQEDIRILEEEAAHYSLYIQKSMMIPSSKVVKEDSWFYQRIAKIIYEEFDIKDIVPIPMSQTGHLGNYQNSEMCRYMPLIQNKNESWETMIHFYQSFITKA